MRRLLAAGALVLAACSKPAGGPDMSTYQDAAGRYSVSVPSRWRVQQRVDGASLFGPPDGPAAFTASLSLSSQKTDAGAYQAAQAVSGAATPLAPEKIAGRDGFRFQVSRVENALHSNKTVPVTIKFALVPLTDGLLVVSASANPGGEAAADDALAKALASLQIK
jgi:hypothetical protein